jgi:hypothetical protein
MDKNFAKVLAVVCMLAAVALSAIPALAQSDVKDKPPMYSYVGNWAIPRAQWGEMDKANTADQPIYEKAFSAGTLVGYGNDVVIVHQGDGQTHDEWWSSMSMAGLLNVLDQFYKSGSSTTSVLTTATKHWDGIYVSRYYNWHKGSWKDVYTRVAIYKLKPDAPNDAVDTLSRNLFVPFFEKQLADGNIHEYEIDTETIHTDNPAIFSVVFIAANAEGLDKVNAALAGLMKANPLGGPAIGSMVDFSAHRDELLRTNATYK